MRPADCSGEGASFYVPFQADPVVSGPAFVGLSTSGGRRTAAATRTFLDNHCFTDGGPKGDMLFTGACGDWMSLGKPRDSPDFGADRGAGDDGDNYVAQTTRAPSNTGTLWAATRLGRVFITQNANATGHVTDYNDPFGAGVTLHNENDVVWTRIDDGPSAHPASPQRFPSGISVDANDPTTRSSASPATTPTRRRGRRRSRVRRPLQPRDRHRRRGRTSATTSATSRSRRLLDSATGDIYVVDRLRRPRSWRTARPPGRRPRAACRRWRSTGSRSPAASTPATACSTRRRTAAACGGCSCRTPRGRSTRSTPQRAWRGPPKGGPLVRS